MAKNRVKQRVLRGGHNIPEQTIVSRYYSGIKNLFELYVNKVDEWALVDSSESNYKLIASSKKGVIDILNEPLFQEIKNQSI